MAGVPRKPGQGRAGVRDLPLPGDRPTSSGLDQAPRPAPEVATEKFILDHLRPEGAFLRYRGERRLLPLLAASLGSKAVAFEPQRQIAGLLRDSVDHNRLGHLIRVRGARALR